MAAHSLVCVGLSTHRSAAVLFSAVGHSSQDLVDESHLSWWVECITG